MVSRRKLLTIVGRAVQVVLVLLAIAAVGLDGVAVAPRLFDVSPTPSVEPPAPADDVARLLAGPPAPDELPQNMAPSGHANTEQVAWRALPATSQFEQTTARWRLRQMCEVESLFPSADRSVHACDGVTVCQIDTELGRSLTLVGARPMGTS